MDESFLNDLLECSVCLEQLDSTSKVLPCQHTFCKRCLEDIVSCHKELRCPECRILVETKVEDLPCNILLIRLLEGIKSTAALNKNVPSTGRAISKTESMLFHNSKAVIPSTQWQHSSASDLRAHIKQAIQPLPCAKALYPYEGKRLGDLSFKKGDMIVLRKRVDQNWYEGETNGKLGYLPATHIQIVVPLHFSLPQGKALYDFQASNKDDKDCLTFLKGETVTLSRRIDSNWAEGNIGERAGIFPVSFVELNAAAKALMRIACSQQITGPSSSSLSSSEIQPMISQSVPSSVANTHPLPLPAGSAVQSCTSPSSSSSPSVPLSTSICTCVSSPVFTSMAMNVHSPFATSLWQAPSLPLASPLLCHATNNLTYLKHNTSSVRENISSHQTFPVPQSTVYQEQDLCASNATPTSNNSTVGFCSSYKRDHSLPSSSLLTNYLDVNNQSFPQTSSHAKSNYHREQTMSASADVPSVSEISRHDGHHSRSMVGLSPTAVSSYETIPAPDEFSKVPLHQNSYTDDQTKMMLVETTISPEVENNTVTNPVDSPLQTEEEHTSSLSDSCRTSSRENSPKLIAQMFSPISNISNELGKGSRSSSPLLASTISAISNETTQNLSSISDGIQRAPTPVGQSFQSTVSEDVGSSQTFQKEKCISENNQQFLQNVDHSHGYSTSNNLTSSVSQTLYCPDSTGGSTNPVVSQIQPSAERASPQWKEQNETVNVCEDAELDNEVAMSCEQMTTSGNNPLRIPETNGLSSSQPHYLALYNYQPQKKDELELKRGELYLVNEKCQDGWFKGTSVKTGLSGVFPGNYVQLAKFSVLQSPLHGPFPVVTNTRPISSTVLSGSQSNIQAMMNHKHTCNTSLKNIGNVTYGQVISERSMVPNSMLITSTVYSKPQLTSYSSEYLSGKQNTHIDSPFVNDISMSEKLQSSSISYQLPWTTRSPVLVAGGSVSLTQMVEGVPKPNINGPLRSQWPTQNLSSSASSSPLLPECSLKTASNSGSTDCLSSMGQLYATQPLSTLESQVWQGCSQGRRISRHSPLHTQSVLPATSSGNTAVNGGISAVSSSLPVSSCSQSRSDKPKERKEKERVSLMKRLTKKKSKSPPPAGYSTNGSGLVESSSSNTQSCLPLVHVRSVSCPSEALGSQSSLQKKSSSLDGNMVGASRLSSRSKQPIPLIKERFRCIVPYPPNSDYELELKVGDIVYVHKKRDDGWYKGTLQRTGRTGLFPASFVESF